MDIDKTIDYAKRYVDEVQFKELIEGIDLNCRKCGQCCIIPAIPKIGKEANKRCQYLTDDNLCTVYTDFEKRPQGCAQWPVLDSHYFMIDRPINEIKWQWNICPIIQEFWERIYKLFGE